MARIQVLPLTTQIAGAVSHTPFVLIIDQAADAMDDFGSPVHAPEMLERLKAELGAQSVLVVEGELTVANVDEEAWAEAFRNDRGSLVWLPPDEPRTVRLDDDSIDRLATAIADKLKA